ncbi:methyltransferase [uncultured Roseobacter sp.]|uniref:tRNA1(Val) (adenine(37)-N6)-methyltransferase n=1 Tax=uncultured Roseobacter sp. TaxID=114847 RepID=UPI00260B6380|nr:methyltransferase [uncultured Roseobacter sp.]
MTEEVTRDAFLGGRVQLWQPRDGFRAGNDSVLLAASVSASQGQTVLDLGCGVGAAALCLRARVPGLRLTGVEIQPRDAALARRNGGPAFEVITADIAALPPTLLQRQFDHVLTNPPYYDRRASRSALGTERECALGETTPLSFWVKAACKRLRPKGYLHLIHLAERLPDILDALPSGMGSVEVLPIAARTGRSADRIILRARKNGRAAFTLHSPLIMHEGADHVSDAESYVAEVRAVLRDGAALEF